METFTRSYAPPSADTSAFDFFEFDSLAEVESRRSAVARDIHSGFSEFDYELDSLQEPAEETLARAKHAAAIAGMSDDIDLMVESWDWSETVPRRAVAGEGLNYDYEFEFALDDQLTESSHAVLFFDEEADRLREVVAYTVAGWQAGEHVLLALTAELKQSVTDALPAQLRAQAERDDRLTILDAQRAIGLLVIDGALDRNAFAQLVARDVREKHARTGGLRVYGEMVTVLWARGDVVAALELEDAWNELQRELAFTTLCAYPVSLTPEGSEGFAAVCVYHTETHRL